MWIYDKKLQFPVNVRRPDARAAKIVITQFGGPDGELAASQRYLSQRYAMPYDEVKATLTDIGTEEQAHRLCRSGKTERRPGAPAPVQQETRDSGERRERTAGVTVRKKAAGSAPEYR